MGLGAGMALGQVLAQNLQAGLHPQQPAPAPAPAPVAPVAPVQTSDDIIAMLEKIGNLKAKGILSEEEFAIKKAELLKKLG